MADLSMKAIRDPWLSNIIKRKTYKILFGDSSGEKGIDPVGSCELDALCKDPVFLYTKVSPASLASAKFLEKKGFYLVDTNMLFVKQVSKLHKMKSKCEVRFATRNDESGVVGLAKKAFKYSRFHLDTNISNDVANTIKAEWARNYFVGKRGEYMVVAADGKAIVGFLQLLDGKNGTLIIDLIAVDDSYRRRGIAADMIAYAEANCHNFKKIMVGTQIANIPSIQFYGNMGFKFLEAYHVFHFYNA